MLSEETAIQQIDGVDMLPLELGLLRASILCLSGTRSSANMPGNVALCEPIGLQSECPSMNTATFYKHSRHIYTLKALKDFTSYSVLDHCISEKMMRKFTCS